MWSKALHTWCKSIRRGNLECYGHRLGTFEKEVPHYASIKLMEPLLTLKMTELLASGKSNIKGLQHLREDIRSMKGFGLIWKKESGHRKKKV